MPKTATSKMLDTDKNILCKLEELCVSLHKEEIQKHDYSSLRDVINWCQILSNEDCPEISEGPAIIALFEKILSECILPLDGLLLLAIAHCSVMAVVLSPFDAFQKFMSYLRVDIKNVHLTNSVQCDILFSDIDCFKLCVSHGMLHSRCFLTNVLLNLSEPECMFMMLQNVFYVLLKLCSRCSKLTLVAFRTLHSWLEKVGKIDKQRFHLSPAEFESLFSLVMTSWENPISNVRPVNFKIFSLLLDICEVKRYVFTQINISVSKLIESTIDFQPWNLRQKYFVLDALIPKYGAQKALKNFPGLVPGLIWSLKSSHLVSASTNTYKICLKNINSDVWIKYFMPSIINILFSNENICISVQEQNLFTHWMFHSLKLFPSLLDDIANSIVKLVDFSQPSEKVVFSILSLVTLEHKLGLSVLLPDWKAKTDISKIVRELVKDSLSHSNDILRSLAFAVVCTSSRSSVPPSKEEFELISVFLVRNINTDNTSLRENVLKYITSFLIRVRDSCWREFRLRDPIDNVENCKQKLLCVKSVDTLNKLKVGWSGYCPTYKSSEQSVLLESIQFLDWLYHFLIGNLETGTNYQRKLLSLRIYELVLRYVGSENVHKESDVRIMKYMNKCGIWHFNSEKSRLVLLTCFLNEDVRVKACQILIDYFKVSVNGMPEAVKFIKIALNLCQSSLFFVMESGALLIKLVAAWLNKKYYLEREKISEDLILHVNVNDYLENVTTSVFERSTSNVDELHKSVKLTQLFISHAEKQWNLLKQDLFVGSRKGAPLHGMLMALSSLALQPEGLEYKLLNDNDIERILQLIESVSEHMLNVLSSKSEITEFSPSFAEMGIAIESTIQQSFSDQDEMYLSSAYQLVLSCIWLNLKACCWISAELANIERVQLDINIVQRCGKLIVSVLTRCRHKGAIEAAGIALANFVKTVTANHNVNIRTLPVKILTEFLDTLNDVKCGSSVTRRSAGYGILVHQIVSSDKQIGMPILHLCIPLLLQLANKEIDETTEMYDLPQTEALHFLRTLVQDASIREDVAQYLSSISSLCFEKLSSDIWAVRNAALQLFGALLPRLVGQKTTLFDNIYNSCLTAGEFFCRFPELTKLLLTDLEQICNSTSLLVHCKAIPTLTLLSRLTVTHKIFVTQNIQEIILKFQKCFMRLLSSQSYVVRNLSARSYAAFISFSEIEACVKCLTSELLYSCVSENHLNGILLLIKYINEKLNSSVQMQKTHQEIINSVYCELILKLKESKCFNKSIFNSLYSKNNFSVMTQCFDAQSLEHVSPCCDICPGKAWYLKSEIDNFIKSCSEDELEAVFCKILKFAHNDFNTFILESVLESTKSRVERGSISSNLKIALFFNLCFEIYNSTTHKNFSFQLHELLLCLITDSSFIFDFISKISSSFNFPLIIDFDHLEKILSMKNLVTLPAMCGLLAVVTHSSSVPQNILSIIQNVVCMIQERCDCSKFNEDYRLSAAMSLNTLSSSVKKLLSNNSIIGMQDVTFSISNMMLDSVLKLLQDENSEIRNEMSKFIVLCSVDTSFSFIHSESLSPYHCVHKLLHPDFLQNCFTNENAIKYLWLKLQYDSELQSYYKLHESIQSEIIINPFDCAVSNIYMEKIKFLDIILTSMLQLVSLLKCNSELATAMLSRQAKTIEGDINELWTSLESNKNHYYHSIWTSQVSVSLSLVMKKLHCQLLLMRHLQMLGSTEQEEHCFHTLIKCLDVLKTNFFIYVDI